MKYFLLPIVVALLASPAMGVCNVPQPRLVCAEYFASQLVVEATLLKTRTVGQKEAFVYSLRADRVIRGQIAGVFRVREGNDSGRAPFDWKIGRRYLLFLLHSETDKSWGLDGCGNSGPVVKAKAVLQQIEAIQKQQHNARLGTIHGVVSEQTLAVPISKAHVEARGDNGVYGATTDENGEFKMRVPPGRYSVRTVASGFSFGTADFSYENPDNLRIEPGGCAQVQLADQKSTP